jgi:hypothetical protein
MNPKSGDVGGQRSSQKHLTFGTLKSQPKKFAYTFFLYLNFNVLLIFGAKTIPDF